MVRVIGRVEFVCPYCDASYEGRSEAENCAQLCAPVDDVVRKELDDLFVCEMCDVKWDSRDEAMKCEREKGLKLVPRNVRRRKIESGVKGFQNPKSKTVYLTTN